MREQRRFQRLKIKLPVKIRIFDKETGENITHEIDASTENVSKAGMCLMVPQSWDCPECNKCLGWIYNLGCKLKNNHTQDDNRCLSTKLNFRISLFDASLSSREPVLVEAQCAWVGGGTLSQGERYPVGVSIAEPHQKKIAAYFSNRINP